MIDLEFVKAFIDCVTRASQRSGEILHGTGIEFQPVIDKDIYKNHPERPEPPYFVASIAYTFVNPYSQDNKRDWLVYVAYYFKIENWSSMIYHQRIVAPSVYDMNDELVDWIVGAVTALKQEKQKASSGFYVM